MALVPGKTQTLEDVKNTIAMRKRYKQDPAKMAHMLLRFGNLERQAHEWLRVEFPQHANVQHQQGWTSGRS
jgi:purine nucleoside permease